MSRSSPSFERIQFWLNSVESGGTHRRVERANLVKTSRTANRLQQKISGSVVTLLDRGFAQCAELHSAFGQVLFRHWRVIENVRLGCNEQNDPDFLRHDQPAAKPPQAASNLKVLHIRKRSFGRCLDSLPCCRIDRDKSDSRSCFPFDLGNAIFELRPSSSACAGLQCIERHHEKSNQRTANELTSDETPDGLL